jgi:hypothetical protein
MGALVGFYHACLGFPVKQTWLDAIKAGNCDTFNSLTYSNAAKYCPDSDKTIMGHLAQQRQNGRSTKPKQPTPAPLVCPPPPIATPSNQVFVMTQPLSKLFTDDTGRFPVTALLQMVNIVTTVFMELPNDLAEMLSPLTMHKSMHNISKNFASALLSCNVQHSNLDSLNLRLV